MGSQGQDISGKRELNKQRNRAEILDAARAVFVEIGYDAATIRDVVARTDLAPGTFYNYFPDKRTLLVALIRESGAEGARLVREARARATTLEEFVYNGFRAFFEFIGSGDRPMFELLRRNIAVIRTLGIDETGFALGLEQMRADLEAAIASELVPDIPLDYALPAIGAIAFEVGAVMVASDPPDIQAATHFASELCLGGLQRIGRPPQRRPAQARAAQPGRANKRGNQTGK